MPPDTTFIERLIADEPALLSSLDFGPYVAQGTGNGPSLLIGDMSQISLMRSAQASHLEYRMAHLARPGDAVLIRNRDPDFETYLVGMRGLDDVTFLTIDPGDDSPVARQAMRATAVLDRLIDMARKPGGLTIKSYLTTGSVWRLAQTIGEAAGCVVHVSGPSPRVSKRANDKLWFARLARAIIGGDAVPPTMSAYGPEAAAGLISRLAGQGQQVIVKVPDSAGSAGNIRLDGDRLAPLTPQKVTALLLDRLHATGWSDSYPILVGVWDNDVTCSPSVQMWIPHAKNGPPQAQGVFEQSVYGEAAAFVGAMASTLPHSLQDRLMEQAIKIASALQRLGYYGNCSFDAVICGKGADAIHWIECNGRWSGVSIPMTALGMMGLAERPKGVIILQEKLQDTEIDSRQAITALHDVLYQSGTKGHGIVLLSPPEGVAGSIANLLVFAESQPKATRLSATAIARLKATT